MRFQYLLYILTSIILNTAFGTTCPESWYEFEDTVVLWRYTFETLNRKPQERTVKEEVEGNIIETCNWGKNAHNFLEKSLGFGRSSFC
jgi:hypothetical protein